MTDTTSAPRIGPPASALDRYTRGRSRWVRFDSAAAIADAVAPSPTRMTTLLGNPCWRYVGTRVILGESSFGIAWRGHAMRPVGPIVLALAFSAGMIAPAQSQQRVRTTRASVSSSESQGNGSSSDPAISGRGRRVAFASRADDLVDNDSNGSSDVFVRNLRRGTTTRISVSSSGEHGNDRSVNPSLSTNGRWVAFASDADNLMPNDTNGNTDIFVHDLSEGTTTLVSVSSSGRQGNRGSRAPSISAGGKRVAFESVATNLVPNDTNEHTDVFVHNLQTGKTRRVSLSSSGRQGNDESYSPSVAGQGSIEGRYIAFVSVAGNLVRQDTNGRYDVFFRDLRTGTTKRASVSSSGKQANRFSYAPQAAVWPRRGAGPGSLRVAFGSKATNLVPKDTNGYADVFVHNARTGKTKRVSVSTSGKQGNGHSSFLRGHPHLDDALSISASRRKVSFESIARNLVRRDNNRRSDIFIRNLRTGTTKRVSVSSRGKQANGGSHVPAISANGRRVAFDSLATNLVRRDTNGRSDVFVRRRR